METIPNGNIENRVGIFNKQKNGSGKHLLYQEVKPFKSFKFLWSQTPHASFYVYLFYSNYRQNLLLIILSSFKLLLSMSILIVFKTSHISISN